MARPQYPPIVKHYPDGFHWLFIALAFSLMWAVGIYLLATF